jgi:adenylate kinase family enzyme/nicotinamide mononucleotide adenylyltransferase
VGVYFGSFDPIHENHMAVALHAISAFAIEHVVFVPNCDNPFKQFASPLELRERLITARIAAFDHEFPERAGQLSLYRFQGDERWDWAGRAFICKRIRNQYQQSAVRVFQLIGQDSFEAPTAQRALSNSNVRNKLSRTLLVFPRISTSANTSSSASSSATSITTTNNNDNSSSSINDNNDNNNNDNNDNNNHQSNTTQPSGVHVTEQLQPHTQVVENYRDPLEGCSSTQIRQELYASGTSKAIHADVAKQIKQLGMYSVLPTASNRALLMLLGGPASGKGTLAQRLVERFGAVHFSGGEFYRLAFLDADFARELKRLERLEVLQQNQRSEGRDALLRKLVAQSLEEFVARSPEQALFVIDGITEPLLAEHAIGGKSPDLALYLQCSDEVLLARAVARGRDSAEIEEQRVAAYPKKRARTEKTMNDYLNHGRSTKLITLDAEKPIDEYLAESQLLEQIEAILAAKNIPIAPSQSTDALDALRQQVVSHVLGKLRASWPRAGASSSPSPSPSPSSTSEASDQATPNVEQQQTASSDLASSN